MRSRARGQVVPAGRVQVIQASDGGVISKIEVNEGDHVRRGQLLMTLDSVKVGSAVEATRARVAALKGTLTRIETELFHKPLHFPADVADRKSTRLNSSHSCASRMPPSALKTKKPQPLY